MEPDQKCPTCGHARYFEHANQSDADVGVFHRRGVIGYLTCDECINEGRDGIEEVEAYEPEE